MSERQRVQCLIIANAVFQIAVLLALAPAAIYAAKQSYQALDFVVYCIYIFLIVGALNLGIAAANLARVSMRVTLIVELVMGTFLMWTQMFYIHYGLQLDHPLAIAGLRGGGMNGTKLPTSDLVKGGLSLVVLCLFQFAHSYSLKRFSRYRHAFGFSRGTWIRLAIYSAACACALVFLIVEADPGTVPEEALPLFATVTAFSAPSIHFQFRPDLHTTRLKMKKRPDVLFILSDAVRWDQISMSETPNIFKLKESRTCFSGTRHYAGSHMTQFGGFSFLYGMNSFLSLPFSEGRRKSPALQILRDNGYKLFAFDASGLLLFSPTTIRKADFDFYTMPTDRARTIEEDKRMARLTAATFAAPHSEPTFVFTFFYSTHAPYSFESRYADSTKQEGLTGESASLYSRYQSSIHFVDELVGTILRDAGPGMVIAFSGDHGEEFGEFGSVGHASVGFNDFKTRVPLILCLPGEKGREVSLSSHADIFPTLFDWASEGKSLDAFDGISFLHDDPEHIYVSAAHFPRENQLIAAVTQKNKYVFRLDSHSPQFKLVSAYDDADRPLTISNSISTQAEAQSALLKATMEKFLLPVSSDKVNAGSGP
jgi:hypothetical protein